MNLRACVVEVVQRVPDVDVAIVAARVAERLSMPSERVRKLIEGRTGPITKALRPDKAEAIAHTFQAAGVRVIVRAAEPDEIEPPPEPAAVEQPSAEQPPAEQPPADAVPVEDDPGDPSATPSHDTPAFAVVLPVESPAVPDEGPDVQAEEREKPVARLRVEFEPPRVAELQPAMVGQAGVDEHSEEGATAMDGDVVAETQDDPAGAAGPEPEYSATPSPDHVPAEMPPAIVVDDEPEPVTPALADDFARGRGWDSEVPLSWDAGSLRDDHQRLQTVGTESADQEVEADGTVPGSVVANGRAGRSVANDETGRDRVPTAWRGLAGEDNGPARPEGARLPRRGDLDRVEDERIQRRRGTMLILLLVAIAAFVFTQWWVASRATATAGQPGGMHAFHDGDFASARRLWLIQAGGGGAMASTAQFMLGYLAEAGLGTEWSARTAAAWYLQAATDGHAEAAWRLGRLYQEGLGVSPDLGEARRWYRSAADGGHGEAAFAWGAVLLRQAVGEAAYAEAVGGDTLSSLRLAPELLDEVATAFRTAAAAGWHEAVPYALAFGHWQQGTALQAGLP